MIQRNIYEKKYYKTLEICYMCAQVHITQGDSGGRGVIISWVTPLMRHPNFVTYWAAEGKLKNEKITVSAKISSYRFYNYTSGYIHHATIKKLEVK